MSVCSKGTGAPQHGVEGEQPPVKFFSLDSVSLSGGKKWNMKATSAPFFSQRKDKKRENFDFPFSTLEAPPFPFFFKSGCCCSSSLLVAAVTAQHIWYGSRV